MINKNLAGNIKSGNVDLSDLEGANLKSANLRGSILDDCNIKGADLNNIKVCKANKSIIEERLMKENEE